MSEKKKEVDFDKLKFIRIFTPMHIPKELIEQVRDRDYSVDDWFNFQDVICTRQTPNGPILNPLSMLFVIADENHRVVGMLWCDVEVLSKTLVIQTFSMNKDYWYKGYAVKLLADKAKEIARDCGFRKICWFTRYPKHSQRYGFKRARDVMMEYEMLDEELDHGKFEQRFDKGNGTSAEHDTGTKIIPGTGDERTGTSSTERAEPVSTAV